MAGLYGHDWRRAFAERSRSMKLSLDLEKMKSLREERLRVKPIAMWQENFPGGGADDDPYAFLLAHRRPSQPYKL